jgi:hypothetical protein
MSITLKPAQHHQYRRIHLLEELISNLLETARRNGWKTDEAEKLLAACGKVNFGPLEEVVDPDNIHAWLQGQMEITETRLARLVTTLLKADPSRLDALKETAYRFGLRHKVPQGAGPSEAYQAITETLLDGMPCDGVNQVTVQEADRVVWKKTRCVHRGYWETAGGEPQVYAALRGQLISGMLAGSGLTYRPAETGVFEIRKQ